MIQKIGPFYYNGIKVCGEILIGTKELIPYWRNQLKEEYKMSAIDRMITYIESFRNARIEWAESPDGRKKLGPDSPTIPGMQDLYVILDKAKYYKAEEDKFKSAMPAFCYRGYTEQELNYILNTHELSILVKSGGMIRTPIKEVALLSPMTRQEAMKKVDAILFDRTNPNDAESHIAILEQLGLVKFKEPEKEWKPNKDNLLLNVESWLKPGLAIDVTVENVQNMLTAIKRLVTYVKEH